MGDVYGDVVVVDDVDVCCVVEVERVILEVGVVVVLVDEFSGGVDVVEVFIWDFYGVVGFVVDCEYDLVVVFE